MKEIFELRIFANQFRRVFDDSDGKSLSGGTFIIKIDRNDPRIELIKSIEKSYHFSGSGAFYSSYKVIRRYNDREINSAELFTMIVKSIFEPSGEDYGTKYSRESECEKCGSGARQVNALFVNERSIPKNKDVVQTIANEILVSRRFIDIYTKNNLTGAVFQGINQNSNGNIDYACWRQMIIENASGEIVPPTKAEISAFVDDEKGEYRCPDGHLLGLNRTTEVTLSRESRGSADIFYSKQYFGQRRGVLRPHREIFVSPKMRSLILEHQLKGVEFEVAYLS
jgi:hypothetical protein